MAVRAAAILKMRLAWLNMVVAAEVGVAQVQEVALCTVLVAEVVATTRQAVLLEP